MPPKRKAKPATGTPVSKAPKIEERTALQKRLSDLRKNNTAKAVHKVDVEFRHSLPCQVYEDYDYMLNQTNIGNNNNKFYLSQIIKTGVNYKLWTRWGRVGEVGQSMIVATSDDPKNIINDFKLKFKSKTKNEWKNRDTFVPYTGKYTLLEMADDEPDEPLALGAVMSSNKNAKVKPSKLHESTYELISRIFDMDMFKEAMSSLNIDVKKMPLGKLSNAQIVKAFGVLEELEKVLIHQSTGDINQLSSQFYTVIPHSFGRQRPTPVSTLEQLREKYNMLNVLADIALAQTLQSGPGSGSTQTSKAKVKREEVELEPNPVDAKYERLNCDLELMPPSDSERRMLEEYFYNTISYGKAKILNIWKVKRDGERQRQQKHDGLKPRRLLWHGTNIAVVAAILKTGLRIMPNSGGRVGAGIYFASQSNKSIGYASAPKNRIIMFLNEVAMGREKEIRSDDSSLKKAPNGYDSVVAMGSIETDSKLAKVVKLDGNEVIVPYGKPTTRSIQTSFSASEYLIYNESQNCIRYLFDIQR